MSEPVRIAMWTGPRNISTAMMRSWGNRGDTVVIDEPFYAFYLHRTGKDHPGLAEIVSQSQTDVYKIIRTLMGGLPGGKSVFYQKHMAHHLLPEIDRSWLGGVTNCFLVRDPAEVITSYIQKNPHPDLEDLGFTQQLELFRWVRDSTGLIPPVVDAKDVLENPERILGLLCRAVGLQFDPAMLCWAAGPRETDGVWAKYWYDSVVRSTSFQPYRPKTETVPERLCDIHQRCLDCYRELYQHRLH